MAAAIAELIIEMSVVGTGLGRASQLRITLGILLCTSQC
jgi:hypothetical protein